MTPNRLFLRILCWFLYLWLSFCVLFMEVPKMLRAADTATNISGFLLVALWFLLSGYAAYSWWYKKSLKKKDSKE